MGKKRYSLGEASCYCTKLIIDNETKHELGNSVVVKILNKQQSTIDKLEHRDYYNQSERYKILGRAIELASEYIDTNNLEYYDFCGLVTEFEEELLEGKEE